MNLSESTATLVHLYTGVFAVLILASLIGQGLKCAPNR